MKLNTPLPQTLPKECSKAAQIFSSFVDRANNGLDGVIPRQVLDNARGFAIYSVLKAGFLLSARAGSGIVIARLDDGSWSAPSAIGTAGMGFGTQAGAELTDVLIVLNSRSAVKSFMSAGSVTLGTNLSVAVGPVGRNGEASGSISTNGKLSATYSYSKTRGLFGGVSLEGSVIVERQDANAIAYDANVSAKQLLSGAVEVPSWAKGFIRTLETCTSLPGGQRWVNDNGSKPQAYEFGGIPSPSSELPASLKQKKKSSPFTPPAWGRRKSSSSYFPDVEQENMTKPATIPSDPASRDALGFGQHFNSDFGSKRDEDYVTGETSLIDFDVEPIYGGSVPISTASKEPQASAMREIQAVVDNWRGTEPHFDDSFDSLSTPFSPVDQRPEHLSRLPGISVVKAIALYDFIAREPGDLSFAKGDIIVVTEKSQSKDDWWTGSVNTRHGIFPANFVELT